MGWFEVSREGLALLLEKRGKGFAILELLQNAWDQKVTTVQASLTPVPGAPFAIVSVADDDPRGFEDLAHAYTLFASSNKKRNPEQRGRFNVGEKLVLALCRVAAIQSTTGTVLFDQSGRKTKSDATQAGSIFTGEIRMTRSEYIETLELIKTVIPPKNIRTIFNGEILKAPNPLVVFSATLPTEIADNEGYLRRTQRQTQVEVYPVPEGQVAHIYEMGLPVVATGDKYHVNILQKVPLNTDRDNVTPGFLQTVRTVVLNNVVERLQKNEASEPWVRAATSDERCSSAAMERVLDLRFGKDRVTFDPTDHEANMTAASRGFTIITGSQLNKQEWDNVKRDNLSQPAGRVFPCKPQFTGTCPPMDEDQLSQGMREVRAYAQCLAQELMGVNLHVAFLDTTDHGNLLATYSREGSKSGVLTFYVKALRLKWFDLENNIFSIDELLIHEFGHQYESNHLDAKYHDALCRLGAKLKNLALVKPDIFTAIVMR